MKTLSQNKNALTEFRNIICLRKCIDDFYKLLAAVYWMIISAADMNALHIIANME